MNAEPDEPTPLPAVVRGSWHRFLETFEPLRSELYRYCRHLTRSPWDAEDLAQDAIARAFVTLGQVGAEPPNPRAWLFRVASNLWIDQQRKKRPVGAEEAAVQPPDVVATREAAGTLLGQLAPQERAAVVLKDVFDLSLEEIADAVATTPGAVKSALHRARGKLAEPVAADDARVPAPKAIDAFCTAFNAADVEALTSLLLESTTIEVVGASTAYGKAGAQRILGGMLFGVARMVEAETRGGIDAKNKFGVKNVAPRIEARLHRGEWLLLHWYSHDTGDAVRAITRLDVADDSVSRLRNYFFTPDFIADVCGELGIAFHPNGYRWWLS